MLCSTVIIKRLSRRSGGAFFLQLDGLNTIKLHGYSRVNTIKHNLLKNSQTAPLPGSTKFSQAPSSLPMGERGEGRGRGDRGAAQRDAEPTALEKSKFQKSNFEMKFKISKIKIKILATFIQL